MSKRHGAREQKKLAKQKAKREAQRKQLARQNSSDPTVRLKAADRWPVIAALVPENLWTLGIGELILARRMPDGKLACAVFLADVFCLGIKNVLWRICSTAEFNRMVEKIGEHGRLQKISPECFSKLVHRTADYGQSLGFSPHRDFRHARLLLEGIDPSQCADEFEFGKNGVPFYIRGPGESIAKAQDIAARVAEAGGEAVIPLLDNMPEYLIDTEEADEGWGDEEEDDDRGDRDDVDVIDV